METACGDIPPAVIRHHESTRILLLQSARFLAFKGCLLNAHRNALFRLRRIIAGGKPGFMAFVEGAAFSRSSILSALLYHLAYHDFEP
jgi:hypothetical protein